MQPQHSSTVFPVRTASGTALDYVTDRSPSREDAVIQIASRCHLLITKVFYITKHCVKFETVTAVVMKNPLGREGQEIAAFLDFARLPVF
jgi:hypothetical protein